MERKFVFDVVSEECDRQIEKWGRQKHSNWFWLLILLEEIGEVCEAILQDDRDQITAELIQCAAVIVSWLSDSKRHGEGYHITQGTSWILRTMSGLGEGCKRLLESPIRKR